MLASLLRDGGLRIFGCSEFISTKSGLKSLTGFGRSLAVYGAKSTASSSTPAAHPEGGSPPKSQYRPGRTLWKWVSTYYGKPKEWIEFHCKTGYKMDEYVGAVECGEIEDE
jgi:hypothetical protein